MSDEWVTGDLSGDLDVRVDKYTTIVLKHPENGDMSEIRAAAALKACVSWSMDDEISKTERLEAKLKIAESLIGLELTAELEARYEELENGNS